MKLFVLTDDDYDYSEILGIYSTKKGAIERWRKRTKEGNWGLYEQINMYIYELDGDKMGEELDFSGE